MNFTGKNRKTLSLSDTHRKKEKNKKKLVIITHALIPKF